NAGHQTQRHDGESRPAVVVEQKYFGIHLEYQEGRDNVAGVNEYGVRNQERDHTGGNEDSKEPNHLDCLSGCKRLQALLLFGKKRLVGIRNALVQADASAPAKSAEPGDVQQFLRSPIGFGGVKSKTPLKSDNAA